MPWSVHQHLFMAYQHSDWEDHHLTCAGQISTCDTVILVHPGAVSMWRCHLICVGNPIVEIRQYHFCLISQTGKMASLYWKRSQSSPCIMAIFPKIFSKDCPHSRSYKTRPHIFCCALFCDWHSPREVTPKGYGSKWLTHWGWDKIAAVSQMTLSNAFSWMKMLEFWLRFHWSLFLRVKLTTIQHWFR